MIKIGITAILCVFLLEFIALQHNIDGVLLRFSISSICSIVTGLTVHILHKKNK